MERKIVGDDRNGDYIIQITLFDSNHCPGSCMTLLSGYMGTFLHTGDMRATNNFI